MTGVRHPTAIIDDGATIGADTNVWHHVHIRSGAVIGSGCNIGKNGYIDTGATLGDRVKVQNNVSVYQGVTVGDDVFLGPSCVFTNDRYPRASNVTWDVVPTVVHNGASIGANATLICGITVGAWSVVAAGSVVTKDVQDHQLVIGNPARPSGWVCTCGRVVSRELSRPESLVCGHCLQEQG